MRPRSGSARSDAGQSVRRRRPAGWISALRGPASSGSECRRASPHGPSRGRRSVPRSGYGSAVSSCSPVRHFWGSGRVLAQSRASHGRPSPPLRVTILTRGRWVSPPRIPCRRPWLGLSERSAVIPRRAGSRGRGDSGIARTPPASLGRASASVPGTAGSPVNKKMLRPKGAPPSSAPPARERFRQRPKSRFFSRRGSLCRRGPRPSGLDFPVAGPPSALDREQSEKMRRAKRRGSPSRTAPILERGPSRKGSPI